MDPRPLLPLAALVALLTAAGLAAAAPPSETGWSPAGFPADVQTLDLSDDSDLAAVGTDDPGQGNDDLHFLILDSGPESSSPTTFPLSTTEGVDAVAVSDDGSGVLAGIDRTDGTNLYFFNRSDAENGIATWTEEYPRGVTAVDVTPDGDHAALVASGDGDAVVRLVETRGGDATLLFEHEVDGPVHDVAVDDDAEWVLAGGEVVENGSSQGQVLLYREAAGSSPVDTYSLEDGLPAAVRTVAVTPDASLAVAGAADGRVVSFTRSGSDLSDPDVTEFEGSQASALEVRPDGGLVAAGATGGVHLLDRSGSGPELVPRWTASTPGAVASLDASADLDHLVAGVSGSDGAILAYHHSTSDPIWTIPDGADHVAVDGEPGHVLAASGSNATAYGFHHDVDAGFPTSNGSLAPTPDRIPVTSEGTTVHADVGIRNLGSLAGTYVATASIPGDWEVSVSPNETEVLPNETGTVDVAMTPGSVSAGRYDVSLEVVSASDPGVRANVTVPVDVSGEADLNMTVSGANATRPVQAGDQPTAFFTVVNRGNQKTDVEVFSRLSPSGSPAWSVQAPDQVGPLGPGDRTSFQVTVTVPDDAPDGDARSLTVTVRGAGDAVSQSIRYVVNPFREVTLDVSPPTRLVNATVPGHYNMTVENQGSVDTEFRFIYERRSSGTPGWTIDAPRSPFVVGSGESRTLPLTIIAPHNGVVDDRVLVKVQVVPEDIADQVHPEVQDNETVSAVFANLPDPDDDPFGDLKDVPGPGAGVLASLAAGAALLRSRGGGRGGIREGGEAFTPRTSETHKNVQAATEDNPYAGPPCCWSKSAR